jgi:hypothetical protein
MKNYAMILSFCCATVVSAMDNSSQNGAMKMQNNIINIPISYEDWLQAVRLMEQLNKYHRKTYHQPQSAQPQPLMFYDIGKRARDDFSANAHASRLHVAKRTDK